MSFRLTPVILGTRGGNWGPAVTWLDMAKKNKLSSKLLLLVSKGSIEAIGHFRLGAHLVTTSGLSIDDLAAIACRDRFQFAQKTLRAAKGALSTNPAQNRLGLGRAYYAMYHAARALVFFKHLGDDHEAHSELPRHLPKDFPNRAAWENTLKIARLERNRAGYDPYPKSDASFATSAQSVLSDAQQFLAAVKKYLIKEGCTL